MKKARRHGNMNISPTELETYHCPHCLAANVHPVFVKHGRCLRCYEQYGTTDPKRFPPMWLVFDRPLDYPNHFVVRVHWGPWGEKRLQLAPTLELARLAVQMEGGSYNLGRKPLDDPKLYEVWV